MANYNKVILIGNLTRDPEMRYTQSGQALVKFGLAVNRKYRTRDQESREETTYVDIEGWGQPAETFNQYMSKGRPVFIEGRLRFDTWESKEGQKRSKLVVVMENFQFLGTGGGGGGGPRDRDAGGGQRDGDRDGDRDGSQRGGGRQRSQQVEAGRVSEPPSGGGGEEYDFEDIPF